MPKHKPIRFEEPKMPEAIKKQIKDFISGHPIAKSALKAVLVTAAIGGVLTLAAVAPGIVGILGKAAIARKKERKERYGALWHSFHHLKKSRSLEYVGEKNGEMVYRLTNDGETKLRAFVLETLAIQNPTKWDGKWRVVVFDIPEKYRRARKAIHKKLVDMGFYPMQKSVLAHPFPCEHEIEFIKDFFNIKPYVDILPVSEMPNGKVLYHFRHFLRKTF